MRLKIHSPFSGGIHPTTYKSLTKEQAIVRDFWPRHVYLSLQLRTGAVLKPIVAVGEEVTRGQVVAVGRTGMIAPIHASVNGIVAAITPHITAHPTKVKCDTIIIRAKQDRRWGTTATKGSFYDLTAEQIIEKVKKAGVVGLGGAGFPTAEKLRFARQKKVKTLVINGGECEPYLTCDDRTMQEHASEVVAGIRLLLKASGAERAMIGVEDNKMKAFERLNTSISDDENIQLVSVPSIYPMGSERHLIKTVTGITVPLGEIATAVGVLVNNVATAQAVYHAVRFNRPLASRVITVSGKGIEQPCNLEVPIGTPVHEILNYCGGFSQQTERLIFGGPMMGTVITSPQVPVDKCVSGILALTAAELKTDTAQECIRCGQCVRACPMGLMPFQMAALTRISEFKKADDIGVNNCLSCGACDYVCPSNIPLVQYFQHAKGAINATRLKEKKSTQAKVLAEVRKARLVKEAEEKKAAKAAKAANRRKRPPRGEARSKGSVKEAVND